MSEPMETTSLVVAESMQSEDTTPTQPTSTTVHHIHQSNMKCPAPASLRSASLTLHKMSSTLNNSSKVLKHQTPPKKAMTPYAASAAGNVTPPTNDGSNKPTWMQRAEELCRAPKADRRLRPKFRRSPRKLNFDDHQHQHEDNTAIGDYQISLEIRKVLFNPLNHDGSEFSTPVTFQDDKSLQA